MHDPAPPAGEDNGASLPARRVADQESLPNQGPPVPGRETPTCCKVVCPGRTFLRRMFNLLKSVPRRQWFIRLNTAFRSDLAWWGAFMEGWNGISMVPNLDAPPDALLFSDASGGFGCGAWSDQAWFQYLWPDCFASKSIAAKELLPIVMACFVWGTAWRQRHVLAHCNNQAVVEVINAGSCRDPDLMQLLRSLFFVTAHLQITLRAVSR